MVAVGNKNPNKLTVQYNRLAMANSRPNVPNGMGARDHSQRGPNRKALYATGIKIRIGNGVYILYGIIDPTIHKQANKQTNDNAYSIITKNDSELVFMNK